MDVIGDKSNKHIFKEINLFNAFSDLIYEIKYFKNWKYERIWTNKHRIY